VTDHRAPPSSAQQSRDTNGRHCGAALKKAARLVLLASLVELVDPRRMVAFLIDQAEMSFRPRNTEIQQAPRVAKTGGSALIALDRSARRQRLPRCGPRIAGRNGDTRNAFACPRSLIPISRWSRTGSPSSRSSLHWPSWAGSPRAILRCSATNSIRSFNACFGLSPGRWRRQPSYPCPWTKYGPGLWTALHVMSTPLRPQPLHRAGRGSRPVWGIMQAD
jgi:hypothetical protein